MAVGSAWTDGKDGDAVNWLVIVDGAWIAKVVIGLCVFVIVAVVVGVMKWADHRRETHGARQAQDFAWERAKRFMELGDRASLALLLQKRRGDLSRWQQRVTRQWMEAQCDNDT